MRAARIFSKKNLLGLEPGERRSNRAGFPASTADRGSGG
jgi:hypothetical protein